MIKKIVLVGLVFVVAQKMGAIVALQPTFRLVTSVARLCSPTPFCLQGRELHQMNPRVFAVFQTVVKIHLGEWLASGVRKENEELFSRSALIEEDIQKLDRAEEWIKKEFPSSLEKNEQVVHIFHTFFKHIEKVFHNYADSLETVADFKKTPEFRAAVQDCVEQLIVSSRNNQKKIQSSHDIFFTGC